MYPSLVLPVAAFAAAFVLPQSSSFPADELAAPRELARGRYERVHAELARADLSSLSSEQRSARAELLAVLDAYLRRADFGVQRDDPDARIPRFIDDEGRRCAMAELLHATGEDDLVADVSAANNEAWIVDLSEHDSFLRWLDASGLTLWEAARIQGPPLFDDGAGDRRGGASDVGPGDRNGKDGPPPPNTTGSGAGPAVSGPGAPPETGSPFVPGAASTPAPAQGPAGPSAAPPVTMGAWAQEDTTAWWVWWEFNKVEFLRPNRLAPDRAQMDDDTGRTFVSQIRTVRRTLLPSLLRALDHADARVRAAAAVAVGRAGGAEAVEPLLARLGDSSLEVRDMAILGLGATGAPAARALLVELAREGRIDRGEEVGVRARALAIVALGLGRKVGFDAAVDTEVAAIAAGRRAAEKEPLGVAAMTYALLSPSPTLEALACELATDASEPVAVRCRAIEALRGSTDAKTLSTLQHLLSGARIEMRRSAALALGEFDHPLASAALMTAHDLEKEPLTRAFLLVSLGRQGGEIARDYLIETLTESKGTERPWAALGLGLVAHASSDPEATLALRESVTREKRPEDRGAYWLALGLARDHQALDLLRDALEEAADARTRMYAAQALAMLRSGEARDSLLQRIPNERSSLARSQIALALGVLGEPGDVDPIASVLASVTDPALQGQLAAAMAFHGSTDALHRLGELCVRDRAGIAERAASIDALGMILSQTTPLALGETTRSSNFTMFGDWLAQTATTTL